MSKVDKDVFSMLYSAEELLKKKAEAFDKISERFYYGNFGSSTKAEIELLMFGIYMDALQS